MSRPSRLIKPSKQSRREPLADRSQMLIVGERLMRAGSEGNLVRPRVLQQQAQKQNSSTQKQNSYFLTTPEPVTSGQSRCSSEDEDFPERKLSITEEREQHESWSPRGHAAHALAMHPRQAERRREAFLQHLKLKYPHHASAIMGRQDRQQEHVRGPVHSGNPQPVVGEAGEQLSQVSLESLEAMSEGDTPGPFTRGSRTRASLPVVKSSNQTKDRSLGVLYLQYGEETRQILMPSEVTGLDTVRALFVSAFPQQLSLKMLESPNMAIYIKDHVRNVYYELTDIRNIMPHSCLKVYHKDPAQAFSPSSRTSNGDARLSHERLFGQRHQVGGQTMVHSVPPPHSPIHAVQGSMSPPATRSMPSSPSRLPYGSRTMTMPGGATLPRERLPSAPPARSITTCSSAILERRDVKPDEDVGGKNVMPYADPYALGEGRLSMASSQGTHSSDVPDGAVFVQHRSLAKSVGSYSEVTDPQPSLYRQKSRKYSENQHVPLASKTPPPSPHRVSEVRMIDIHPVQNAHMLTQGSERVSPVRRSFRKDSNGAMEPVARVRGNMTSSVFADLPPGHGDRPFQGLIPADSQSQRMKAMEQQIASLTGLVQHALLKGTNTSGVKENLSEKSLSASPSHSINSGGVSPGAGPKSPPFKTETITAEAPPPAGDPAFNSILSTFQNNVSSLRQQLHQLRQMQLKNQDSIRIMLQQAEEELTERVCERLQFLEDPVHKQRSQVDEDRHRYLAMEESLLLQLAELENHVDRLKRDSMSATPQRPVTLRDVEDEAVSLRKVGEALAALKGEFPALQLKMRSVLRVEVEAVRFLKEEPHKMDSMLQRVKALTETLSSLRRSATEGSLHNKPVSEKSEEPSSPNFAQDSPIPQPRSPDKSACSELTPSSPVLVQRARSSPVTLQPIQHSVGLTHHPSPPLTPTHGWDAPTVAKVSPRSRADSPATQKKEILCVPEAAPNSSSSSTDRNATLSPKNKENNTNHGDEKDTEKGQVKQEAEAEMERILQQAQAKLMMAIPDLEVAPQEEKSTTNSSATLLDEVDSPQPPAPPPALQTEATALAEPVVDKPVQTSVEKVQKPPKEKPHRGSVDKAHAGLEVANKSPPPPPPRRFYPAGTGLTTGRSGEVIYTARKEPAPTQDKEEGTPHPKPQRAPPEVKPKPQTPPPVIASAARDEEGDDEDKIIAELQVFEKCPVQDLEPRYVVDLTTHGLSDRELEPSFSLSSYDPKNTAHHGEESEHSASPSAGVIYYITGTAKTTEVQKDSSEGTIASSKVAHPNASEFSPRPNILTSCDLTLDLPKSKEENQKEPSDAQQISVSLSKTLADICRAEDNVPILIPKQSNDIITRPEKQVSENLITAQSAGSEVQKVGSGVLEASVTLEESKSQGDEQHVMRRMSSGQSRYSEEASLSPDLPGEEPPPPPDNIAFMITRTRVQALSTGEYQQLVSSKGQDVETVKVGTDTAVSPEDGGFNKKPVIIVFDEPMDIHQAYKRLSTIFECEEELEKMLTEERIDEESEEAEEEETHLQRTGQVMTEARVNQCRSERKIEDSNGASHLPVLDQQQNPSERSELEHRSKMELSGDTKQEAKKKFKFKFAKKQLAAIGQALRAGTKTGKKTLQVVVYEDEEEPDGTLREAREAKRFEIQSQVEGSSPMTSASATPQTDSVSSQPLKGRTNEICKTTYKTLNSLEETIKQLETTISDMDPSLSPENYRRDSKTKRTASQTTQGEGSPLKKPTPQAVKPSKSSQRKKVKVQCPPRTSSSSSSSSSPSTTSTKQNTSSSPSSSGVSSSKSRQPTGSAEKSGKPQKLQDSHRQFRQANWSAFTARGGSKHAFLALPASKIPAFCPSSRKSSSTSTPTLNTPKPASNPSPSFRSSIPCLILTQPGHSSTPPSNKSLRVPDLSQGFKGCGLSLSAQTYCGYCSSSSSPSSSHSSSSVSPTSTSSSSAPSSPSLLSPTAVSWAGQGPYVSDFNSPRLQPDTTSSLSTNKPAPASEDMA